MKIKLRNLHASSSFLPVSLLFLLSVAAIAHHGRGPYSEESTTIEGVTVQRFVYINPHTQLQFTVPGEDGSEVEWRAEAGSPNELVREGIRPDVVSPGDVITVTGFPHNDRPHHLLLSSIAFPDGESVEFR